MTDRDFALKKPIVDVTFVALDVETTGLETYLGHRICEIGLLKFRGAKELDSYSSLVNPKRPIPADIVRIHGITEEMVRDAPVFEDIADDFLAFSEGTVLVAHNADFDLRFIAKHLREAKLELPRNLVVDTLTLARRYFNFPSNSLGAIASRLAIDIEGGHRALKDAATTKGVFEYLTAELEIKTLKQLLDLQGGSVPFPEVGETTLPTINEAMGSGGKLLLRYLSSSGEETERVIVPIEINVHNGTEYLTAFCYLRNKERVFRIDRILKLRPVTSRS